MDDHSRYRRKIIIDLLAHPATLIPELLGATALAASFAGVVDSPWWPFWGIAGLLVGIGAMTSRWIYGGEAIAKRAFESLDEDAQREQKRSLDELDRRLKTDNDPRPEDALRQLRMLYDGFRRESNWQQGLSHASLQEISGKVEKLFKACIISLGRSQDLWDASQKMATAAARKAVLEQREQVVAEVRESVQQLAQTIDGVQALRVEAGQDENLSQIRRELDESLEVARRVEQRMQSLEADLSRSTGEKE